MGVSGRTLEAWYYRLTEAHKLSWLISCWRALATRRNTIRFVPNAMPKRKRKPRKQKKLTVGSVRNMKVTKTMVMAPRVAVKVHKKDSCTSGVGISDASTGPWIQYFPSCDCGCCT